MVPVKRAAYPCAVAASEGPEPAGEIERGAAACRWRALCRRRRQHRRCRWPHEGRMFVVHKAIGIRTHTFRARPAGFPPGAITNADQGVTNPTNVGSVTID